ncbi:MAG: ABC transporter ATP-binding protein [Candidatus Thermoplasmatota archaeon]|nr:ABC transporter ATP-binding protein [Candidatus Thermoplasmatota archaeon]
MASCRPLPGVQEERSIEFIETVELGRSFGEIVAVEGLNLRVREGEVFGFLGPNGAGKTTTVRMLSCLIAPTKGHAYVAGNEVGRNPDSMNIRAMVGLLPETPGLYERLSAFKNLDFYARLYGVEEERRKERIGRLLKRLDLWERRDEIVATFSKGMKQKVAIVRAMVHEPRILFLDEPTAGLDPAASRTVRDFILELKEEGRTIFLNTHNLHEAERVCDRIGVVNTRLLAQGTPRELSARYFKPASIFHLREVTDDLVHAVEALDFVEDLEVMDGELHIVLEDARESNPIIARTIMEAGGKIEFIVEKERGLEDVYLRLVGEIT